MEETILQVLANARTLTGDRGCIVCNLVDGIVYFQNGASANYCTFAEMLRASPHTAVLLRPNGDGSKTAIVHNCTDLSQLPSYLADAIGPYRVEGSVIYGHFRFRRIWVLGPNTSEAEERLRCMGETIAYACDQSGARMPHGLMTTAHYSMGEEVYEIRGQLDGWPLIEHVWLNCDHWLGAEFEPVVFDDESLRVAYWMLTGVSIERETPASIIWDMIEEKISCAHGHKSENKRGMMS